MKSPLTALLLATFMFFSMVSCSRRAVDLPGVSEHDKIVEVYGLAQSPDGTLAILRRSEMSRQMDGTITLVGQNGDTSRVGNGAWELRGWGRDGRYLMYLQGTSRIDRPYRLCVYDQKTKQSLNIGDDTIFDACWAKDGTIVACSQSPIDATEELRTLSLAGRVLNTVPLRVNAQRLLGLALTYNWSANELAVVAHDSPIGSKFSPPELFLVRNSHLISVSGTSGCHILATNPSQGKVTVSLIQGEANSIALVDVNAYTPAAAPLIVASRLPSDTHVTRIEYAQDAKRMLITVSDNAQPHQSSILLYDIASDTLKTIATGDLGTFSLDGKRILYVGTYLMEGGGNYVKGSRVYTSDIDGSATKQIDGPNLLVTPPDAADKRPVWVLVVVPVLVVALWFAFKYRRVKLF